jgi:hypothetical protein
MCLARRLELEDLLDRFEDLEVEETETDDAEPASYRAYQILRVAFTLIPAIAGVDKFFHFLVDWDKYLPPAADRITGGHAHELMLAVGVLEIAAGVGIWLRPRIFGYIVAGWLLLIIVNLILVSTYFDIALRDLGLAVGAIVLAQLSQEFTKQAVDGSKRAVGKFVMKTVAAGARRSAGGKNKNGCECR